MNANKLLFVFSTIILSLLITISTHIFSKRIEFSIIDISHTSQATQINSYEKIGDKNSEDKINHLSNNARNNIQKDIREGQRLFQSGRFNEAVQLWENIIFLLRKKEDNVNQGFVLSYLSLAYQELGNINQAERMMNQALNLLKSDGNKFIQAQVFNNQGKLLLNQGKLENALEVWKHSEKLYRELGDKTGELGAQINQSLALQRLGMYRRARTNLQSLAKSVEKQTDSELQIMHLINLGNVLRLTGDFRDAQKTLTSALHLAQKSHSKKDIQQALFHLGNVAAAQQKFSTALTYYQQAGLIENVMNLSAQVQQVEMLIELKQESKAEKILKEVQIQIIQKPLSQNQVYAQIEIARCWAKIGKIADSAKLLAYSNQQAKILGNPRVESYALGYLGNLYEKTEQWKEAKQLTLKAINLINAITAPEIAYQWEWQMGRLLKATEDISDAINHYSNALNILQSSLHQDLAIVSKDIQFSFRDNVEPIYRQFVDLLLTEHQDISPEVGQKIKSRMEPKITQKIEQENILKARETIDNLQLAEIADFFRQACLDDLERNLDTIDTTAAVIYPIILKDLSSKKFGKSSDRIEVILSLPGQPLQHYATYLSGQEIETAINQMRRSLRRTSFKQERLAIAQKFYRWLLEPAIPELKRHNIKTLVFVLDGSLRNIPIAALHDGNQYLIENYQIAIAPSLQLFNPHPLERQHLNFLFAGLTQGNERFSALPGVKREITQINKLVRKLYPSKSKTLLDQNFTTKALKNRVTKQPFSVVHLATHGQFSSQPENNFILTADGKIGIDTLDKLLTQRQLPDSPPIELLVLSACQTAKGDNRATLGLAGVAIRSGSRSTLASLWTVNDESTSEFMISFYQELLKSGVTKAEALRQAQLHLLKKTQFKHPYFWAPFVLVGSWL